MSRPWPTHALPQDSKQCCQAERAEILEVYLLEFVFWFSSLISLPWVWHYISWKPCLSKFQEGNITYYTGYWRDYQIGVFNACRLPFLVFLKKFAEWTSDSEACCPCCFKSNFRAVTPWFSCLTHPIWVVEFASAAFTVKFELRNITVE